MRVLYYVGHPDISEDEPVRVRLRIDGVETVEFTHTRRGSQEHVFQLPEPVPFAVDLEIEVSRTFPEAPDGRRLGIALYPIVSLP